MENEKIRYSVDGKSFLIKASVFFMVVSMVFRIMGYWGFWKTRTPAFCYMQILLPIVCGILFIVFVLFLGKRAFWITSVPVVLGAIYFVVMSTDLKGILPTVLCVAVSVLTVIVYCTTVFGKGRKKWALIAIFSITLLYHLLIKDRTTILAQEGAMTLNEFIPELSILCIIISLLIMTLAMRKRVPEAVETVEGQELVDELSLEDAMGRPEEKPENEESKEEAKAEEPEKKKLWGKKSKDKAENPKAENEAPAAEEK